MQSYDDAIDGMYHQTSRANMILQELLGDHAANDAT